LTCLEVLVIQGCRALASTGGEKRAFAPPVEIGTKKEKFLENVKSAV